MINLQDFKCLDLRVDQICQAESIPLLTVHKDSTSHSPGRVDWEASCFAAVWGSPEWEQGIRRLFNSTSKPVSQARVCE